MLIHVQVCVQLNTGETRGFCPPPPLWIWFVPSSNMVSTLPPPPSGSLERYLSNDVFQSKFSLTHTVMRQALPKLIEYTTEPKSAEVRRQSQKVLTRLFDLNPATLSLMLNALPRILQESANRILQGYVADMSSSGEESDREKSTTPKKTSPAQRKVCVCGVCGMCGVWARPRVGVH